MGEPLRTAVEDVVITCRARPKSVSETFERAPAPLESLKFEGSGTPVFSGCCVKVSVRDPPTKAACRGRLIEAVCVQE